MGRRGSGLCASRPRPVVWYSMTLLTCPALYQRCAAISGDVYRKAALGAPYRLFAGL